MILTETRDLKLDAPPAYTETLGTPSSPSTIAASSSFADEKSPQILSRNAYNTARTMTSTTFIRKGPCAFFAQGPASHLPRRMPLQPAPPAFAREPSLSAASEFPLMVHYSHTTRLQDGFRTTLPSLTAPYASDPTVHPFTKHDVSEEDWKRFLQDVQITGSLSRKQANIANIMPMAVLGAPGLFVVRAIARNMRKSRIGPVADLIDIWNEKFFNPRRINVVLAQGSRTYNGDDSAELCPPDAHLLDALELRRTHSHSSIGSSSSDSDDSDATAIEAPHPIDSKKSRGSRCGSGISREERRAMKRARRAAKRDRHHEKKELKRQDKAAGRECFRLVLTPTV